MKNPKNPKVPGIAERAAGSILEPPEGSKYDFWAKFWKIETFKNFIEIFKGWFAVFFPYFSVTSLGVSFNLISWFLMLRALGVS